MKALPKGVGAEPKKLMLLGGILLVGAIVLWVQYRPDAAQQTVAASTTPSQTVVIKQVPEQTPAPTGSARTADPVIQVPQRRTSGGGFPSGNARSMADFHPSLKMKDDLDVSKVDPRIRQDLLAKVRAIPMEGGSRSLFEFSKPPEPPAPKVEAIKPTAPVVVPPPVTKVVTLPPPPGPPPPTPIPFKYYGYAGKTTDGQLEGFFREGDASTGDIFPAREGETLEKRYKIIRIGIKSATVEDTTNHNQQTLPLLEEAQ
jgi:hypothetical protein